MIFAEMNWVLFLAMLALTVQNSQTSPPTCKYGPSANQDLEPSKFRSLACCNCYNMLFVAIDPVGTAICNFTTDRIEDHSRSPPLSVEPTLSNSETICDFIGSDNKCQEWKDCCQEAIDCCDEMVEEQTSNTSVIYANDGSSGVTSVPGPECPATFDYFKCWKKAKPSTNPHQPCPEFLISKVRDCIDPDKHYAERECTSDGTWNNSLSQNMFGSNYGICSKVLNCLKYLEDVKHVVEIVCEVISLCAVIPSIFIFFIYRSLFSQQRIKMHINLFIALALYDLTHLIYQVFVRHPDKLEETANANQVECRVLNALTKFSTLAMFMWVFMEGFYLHWLMVNTFKQPKLVAFVVAGWVMPVIFTVIYAAVKATSVEANKLCWLKSNDIDWIIHVPTILSMLLNIIFLVNIMRVILTKLTAHQNEPGYYRRAVKATAILVPPFGLLMVILIYSPDVETQYKTKLIWDIVSAFISHLQGLIISIILCYSNGEVLTNLRKTRSHYLPCSQGPSQRIQDGSMMTAVSHLSTARPSITADTSTTLLSMPQSDEQTELVKKHIANGDNNNVRRQSATDINNPSEYQ